MLTGKFFRSYSHASTTDAQQPNGNGAGVECINWGADLSPKDIDQSASMMVNYLYDQSQIISNHEA